MDDNMNDVFGRVKAASRSLNALPDGENRAVLMRLADAVDASHEMLLEANAMDVSRMDVNNPLYDRLLLTDDRLDSIAMDIRNVASLPSPVGEVIEERILPNGLNIRRVRVPFGVIGVIYEARPNVTFDLFSLCFRSRNACVLKGGADAANSNEAVVSLIHGVLDRCGIDRNIVSLLPSTHDATAALLNAVGYVDVCIPRGGRRLIDFVRDNARIPVIETGAGVVSVYFDRMADADMGADIIMNAKTRRVSVCNALDTLIVHRDRLGDLPRLCSRLAERGVEIHADEEAFRALEGGYPSDLLAGADMSTYATEWMDYKMGIRTVGSIEEAVDHIARYGSGHSECIVTSDNAAAEYFQREVDAACVYVNASTGFTDGAQFGLGAEIGISTQKLGPRGPMGLREICTYRYLINGSGQTRS
ncbi:MAG: glutamate-5-semialdehyde dehydrogenase [Muribaculaceae bacterium]|nr:glutamate-5-semialdehyde dehydrogenase [Muribaculaceae bacterium]